MISLLLKTTVSFKNFAKAAHPNKVSRKAMSTRESIIKLGQEYTILKYFVHYTKIT